MKNYIDNMSFHQKLTKLRAGIIIPPPDRYTSTPKQGAKARGGHEIGGAISNKKRIPVRKPNGYTNWAWRKGRLDEMCAHMERAKMGPKS